MKTQKKHYARGKNPNSHKGGKRVSEAHQELMGTSTHAKEAVNKYDKPFDPEWQEKLIAKRDKDTPYKMVYCHFSRYFSGEPKCLYNNPDPTHKDIRLSISVEHFKNLQDWVKRFEEEKVELIDGRPMREEEKEAHSKYLPWVIDAGKIDKRGRNALRKLRYKPDQDIKGYRKSTNDPLYEAVEGFLKDIGEL